MWAQQDPRVWANDDPRGQTVMLFRAAVLSERFDALHQELHATYTASIAA